MSDITIGKRYLIEGEIYEIYNFRITQIVTPDNFIVSVFFKSIKKNSDLPIFEEAIKRVINNPIFKEVY